MIMNTQQLFYLTEIQRTRSISQAAENLYMSQPNLSRVLREMEENLGFAIFQRTRRGVQPTQKGSVFLQHAKIILQEAEFMERLGPNHGPANRFRVCLPRSWQMLNLAREYLSGLPQEEPLEGAIRECHPRQALELLSNGEAEIALIRFGVEYSAYFSEQAQARGLSLTPLSQVAYRVVLAKNDPLSSRASLTKKDLEGYTEVLHRDIFHPGMRGNRSLYATDRLAQLQLLGALPRCYTLAEPLPEEVLNSAGLAQRPLGEGGPLYQNALVYKPQCTMSPLESGFLDWITQATSNHSHTSL